VTATSFTANWKHVGGATGYRLDVATDSSFVNYVSGYQNFDVGNVTSRDVTGLTADTHYFYRVRAYNGNGTSPNSNVIKVKTKKH
jgi:phosphodiesterase/alkaline phosphatase D-like protein